MYRFVFVNITDSNRNMFIGKEVGTIGEAHRQLETIADYTLGLQRDNLMPEYSNCGVVQKLELGEWDDIEDWELEE